MKEIIIKNIAQCRKCGDIIESTHRHDFKWCKCKAIAVDGGKDYLRRLGDSKDIIELSTFKFIAEEDKNVSNK